MNKRREEPTARAGEALSLSPGAYQHTRARSGQGALTLPLRFTPSVRTFPAALVISAVFTLTQFALPVKSLLAQHQEAAKIALQGLLDHQQAAAIFPPSVFFHGQTAQIQGRNAAGVRLSDGRLILAALVDTSGYASSTAETYQAYLITEVPIVFGDRRLAAGAYGIGFIADREAIVQDHGGHELMRTATARDAEMTRPVPLQMSLNPSNPTSVRLYLGRFYVSIVIV